MPPCLLDLMRPVAGVDLHAELSCARHALRSANQPAVPVVSGGRVAGILTERDLLTAAEREASGMVLTVGDVLPAVPPRVAVSGALSVARAVELVRERDLPLLAVTDPAGGLCGVVARADLLAAAAGDSRPATVGGLATPLGVYLTTGHVRGGASDLGLLLAGTSLMALNLGVLAALQYAAHRFPLLDGDWGLPVFLLLFFLALRFTPLARIHAAEHQVVHAIEKGEPIRIDRVRAQPREHPRCGTNLAAIGLAAQVLLPRLVAATELAGLAVIFLFFTWRRLGWALQRHFTTRKAADRHLSSAIAAADTLLRRYSSRPGYRAPRWRQAWNTGMMQIVAGAIVVYWAFEALNLLPRP